MTTETAATVFYPETDDMPLPDGEYQAPIFRRVVGPLEVHFGNVPGAHVNGNTFLYYVEGDPRRSVSPDCYVVFNLSEAELETFSIDRNNTYLLWEVGKPPDFVLEIGSPSTGREDTGRKRDLYAEIGVPEYWRYDATGSDFYGEPLVGERLVDGEYRRFEMRYEADGSVWSHSDALNLDLWWIDGELRYWDPAGEKWLLNHQEEKSRADSAESRADSAESELELERAVRARAEARAEEERAARLALEAELRRLRGQ